MIDGLDPRAGELGLLWLGGAATSRSLLLGSFRLHQRQYSPAFRQHNQCHLLAKPFLRAARSTVTQLKAFPPGE